MRMMQIPRRKLKERFRLYFQIQGSSLKPAWRPSVPIYSSSIAANIGKKNYQLRCLSTSASHASQLHNCKFDVTQKSSSVRVEKLFTTRNYFRGECYVLLPVSGDTECEVHIAAIAPNVPCIVCWDTYKPEACIEPLGKLVLYIVRDAVKTEVCFEPLGIYYFVLKILANPKRGYVVRIKPIIVF